MLWVVWVLVQYLGHIGAMATWPEHWKGFNIITFYPIVLSLLLWGDLMKNQCIIFFTDNAALVDIINKTTSQDPMVMVLCAGWC
jgi:hypothetical protein